jgi:hypothetical protein
VSLLGWLDCAFMLVASCGGWKSARRFRLDA